MSKTMDYESKDLVLVPSRLLCEAEQILMNHEEGEGLSLQFRGYLDDCEHHGRSADGWRRNKHGVEMPFWNTESKSEDPDASDDLGLRHGRVHRDPGRSRAAKTVRSTEHQSVGDPDRVEHSDGWWVVRFEREKHPQIVEVFGGRVWATADPDPVAPGQIAEWIRMVAPHNLSDTECKSVGEGPAVPDQIWVQASDPFGGRWEKVLTAYARDGRAGKWDKYVRADLANDTECRSVFSDDDLRRILEWHEEVRSTCGISADDDNLRKRIVGDLRHTEQESLNEGDEQ